MLVFHKHTLDSCLFSELSVKLSTVFCHCPDSGHLIPVTVWDLVLHRSLNPMCQNMADLQATPADGISTYVDTWLFSELKTLQNQSSSLVIEMRA